MNRTYAIFRMHAKDKLSWFYLPWIIMLFSFSVNLVIAAFVDEPVTTGGVASMYIYMMVTGMIVVSQTFSFALGLSVSRRDYFNGTMLMAAISGLIASVGLLVLSSIEQGTSGWGVDLHFYHFPYLNEGGLLEQVWIFFVLMTNFFLSGFFISSFQRRYGGMALTLFLAVLAVIIGIITFIISNEGWWGGIGDWLSSYSAGQLASMLFVLSLIYAASTFRLLRKSTVS
ncbi:hypothetical protein [Paenibacillus gansuensis]|uniref:ABC transporter permease n=1 Tax=Paenibacillus gansuensis TaxID=306542 RepID=A0ABW5P8S8_9BACL